MEIWEVNTTTTLVLKLEQVEILWVIMNKTFRVGILLLVELNKENYFKV
jgi:hypothetical protein